MKLKSHLVAAVFWVISFVFALIGFIMTINGTVRVASNGGVLDEKDISWTLTIFIGIILMWVIPIICGFGVFVSGIVEIVQSNQTTTNKGFGLTVGILNVIFAFLTLIPSIGWFFPIAGIILSFIAYFQNTK